MMLAELLNQDPNTSATSKILTGKVAKVSGPIIVGEFSNRIQMYDIVYIGKSYLLGEVIKVNSYSATIQVFENTCNSLIDC